MLRSNRRRARELTIESARFDNTTRPFADGLVTSMARAVDVAIHAPETPDCPAAQSVENECVRQNWIDIFKLLGEPALNGT